MFDAYSGQLIYNSPILWIDLGISIVLIAILLYVSIHIFHSKVATTVSSITAATSIASWFFGLKFVWAITLTVMTAMMVMVLIQYQNELHIFFRNFSLKKKKITTERVYDRHALCQKIAIAVETLSKTKTGALITFEKETKLSDIVKSGTILHSPVTPELLCTIFYPGTRLHDGAVVIRRDEILAASVYYTPTSRPLTGKFGSRHRAAIGISEVTDAVTVVVSEETGRISIAYKGDLISVQPDNFLRTLEDYVMQDSSKEE